MAAIARRQHGVITRAQARQAGMSAAATRWRIERGLWRRLHQGIYLTHTGPIDWQTRASAALLGCGPRSALTLDSAAFLWGLTRRAPEILTVGVLRGQHPSAPPGAVVARRRRLDIAEVGDLRATRVAQTIVDLADQPDRTIDDVLALAARAAQRGQVTEARILTELDARARHRQRRALRLACGELGTGVESVAEILFVTKVQRAHGLPAFAQQVRSSDGRSRTDFRHHELGLIIEVDGRLWHAGERFHTDRQRDRRAAARGELTVRATWHDVDQDPCRLAVDLWQICRRRGWSAPLRRCSPDCPGRPER